MREGGARASGAGAVPAATVVLIRDGRDGLEVLLARRSSQLAFHGGAWVFPGGRIDVIELERHLSAQVARWWVPERWTFIDEVPKTSVGKFDKKVLRARYADGALDIVGV